MEEGAKRLAQLILGSSHLAQSVIPDLLATDNHDLRTWKEDLRETLQSQAIYLCSCLSMCHGLNVVAPQGAMYAMVRISTDKLDVKDDLEFSSLLLKEENVFVLPGSAFGMANAFRVVFCYDEPRLQEAAERIDEFCRRHAKTD